MTISRKRKKEIEAIADKDIDTSDIPETDAEFWANADLREPDRTQHVTLTVRLSAELTGRLGELAVWTRRAKSALAREAIGDYVARELEFIAGIERGLDDMKAGRVVAHEDVAADIDATIKGAARARMKKARPSRAIRKAPPCSAKPKNTSSRFLNLPTLDPTKSLSVEFSSENPVSASEPGLSKVNVRSARFGGLVEGAAFHLVTPFPSDPPSAQSMSPPS